MDISRFAFPTPIHFGAGARRLVASHLLEQDYLYWNLGVSWFPASRIALDLRYLDADEAPLRLVQSSW